MAGLERGVSVIEAFALDITIPMGHESSDDAVARVLPVLRETAHAMRNLIQRMPRFLYSPALEEMRCS